MAQEQGVAEGQKLRADTTAVESDIHYPTDSTLLGDGIRVLSRSLKRIAGECKSSTLEVVHHGRAVKYRLLEISRAAKSLTASNRQRLQESYAKLVALTRGVVRQASQRAPGCRRFNCIRLALGTFLSWLPPTADFFLRRMSGRLKPWE